VEFLESFIESSRRRSTIAKYCLDLMGLQEVTWYRISIDPADDYTFFCGIQMIIIT
jgi:hypothetical protein